LQRRAGNVFPKTVTAAAYNQFVAIEAWSRLDSLNAAASDFPAD